MNDDERYLIDMIRGSKDPVKALEAGIEVLLQGLAGHDPAEICSAAVEGTALV